MNKRFLTGLLSVVMLSMVMLSFTTPVQAEDVSTIGSASVVDVDGSPIEKIVVPKQTLLLNVDVMATTWFTAPPVYPEWNMPGAVIIDSTAQNLALQQRVKGKSYAGVRREFLLIPQQEGTLQVPRTEILLTPALTDDKQTVAVSSGSFKVKMPVGAGDIARFLPGTRLQLTETIEPENLDNLKAGDAITRRISVEVDGILATFIPPVNGGDVPEGAELYTGIPEVTAITTDRGDFIGGRRTETFSYVPHQEGSYTLPGIRLRWWNTDSNRFEVAELPPVSFPVAAAPGAGAEAQLQRGVGAKLLDNLGAVMLVAILAAMGLTVVARYQRSTSRLLQRALMIIRSETKRILTSEPVYFYRMMLALRFGSNHQSIRLYHKWLGVRGGMDETLPYEIAPWLGNSYGHRQQSISHTNVINSLKVSRVKYKTGLRPKYSQYGLPALNH